MKIIDLTDYNMLLYQYNSVRGDCFMDITVDIGDYKLNVRAAGILVHNG